MNMRDLLKYDNTLVRVQMNGKDMQEMVFHVLHADQFALTDDYGNTTYHYCEAAAFIPDTNVLLVLTWAEYVLCLALCSIGFEPDVSIVGNSVGIDCQDVLCYISSCLYEGQFYWYEFGNECGMVCIEHIVYTIHKMSGFEAPPDPNAVWEG